MKLKETVAIVTGGGNGIGKGIALELSKEGAFVVLAEIDEISGVRAADELGSDRALFVKTDVSDSGSVQKMIRSVEHQCGRIDTMINNAGYHISKSVEDTTEAEWDYIINTNLRSVFLCSKYALPQLKRNKGAIINMSSMVGLVGQSNAGAYSATKGGIIAMSKGMALDFAGAGVRVNVICPGWIQTPLVEDWFSQQTDPEKAREYIFGNHPLGRIGTIEECGKAAVFLASSDSAFITGSTINVEGGITLGY